jgi:hypothetical protein
VKCACIASTGTLSARQYLAQSSPAMFRLSRSSVQDDGPHPGQTGRMTVRFDTKIAIAVRADLQQWQKLNVTAFLASGIAASTGEVIGKPYEDDSGNTYLELFRQPVVVYAADAGTLSQAHQRALTRQLPMAIYTVDMFTTGNDDDNRAVVRAVPAAELDFAGLAVHGPRNAVDKIFKGATLHP